MLTTGNSSLTIGPLTEEIDMDYYVYGNYGTDSECELFQSEYLFEAIDFAKRYVRWGDMGGYDAIEVISFKEENGIAKVEANWFNESVFA